jgi:hypothetical protein
LETARATGTPTLSPKLEVTASATNIPTPTPTAEQECLTIEDTLPQDLGLNGVWVYGGFQPYLENIATKERIAIPLRGGTLFSTLRNDSQVSPDGKWLAYIDTHLKNGRTSRRILRAISSAGYTMDMNYWPGDFQWISGWTTNGRLILDENPYSTFHRKYVILDPFTAEYQEFHPEWLGQIRPSWQEDIWLSPRLNYVAILNHDDEGFQIRDVNTGNTLLNSSGWGSNPNQIVWSPRGTNLAVLEEEYEGGTLHLFQAGRETIQHLPGVGFFPELRWSPDEQTLLVVDSSRPRIIEIKTGKSFPLCIDDPNHTYSWYDATWSPEGDFVVAGITRESSSPKYYSWEPFDLLVDLEEKRGFLLPATYLSHREAWLAAP